MNEPLLQNQNSILNDIVPALKNYLDLSDQDRIATREVIQEIKVAIKESRDCSVSMKLQIQHLETHYEMFSSSCKDRKTDCFERFKYVDDKLDSIPSIEMNTERGKKIDDLATALGSISEKMSGLATKDAVSDLKDKVSNLTIKVYVILGVAAGSFAFIKWILPFLYEFAKLSSK